MPIPSAKGADQNEYSDYDAKADTEQLLSFEQHERRRRTLPSINRGRGGLRVLRRMERAEVDLVFHGSSANP